MKRKNFIVLYFLIILYPHIANAVQHINKELLEINNKFQISESTFKSAFLFSIESSNENKQLNSVALEEDPDKEIIVLPESGFWNKYNNFFGEDEYEKDSQTPLLAGLKWMLVKSVANFYEIDINQLKTIVNGKKSKGLMSCCMQPQEGIKELFDECLGILDNKIKEKETNDNQIVMDETADNNQIEEEAEEQEEQEEQLNKLKQYLQNNYSQIKINNTKTTEILNTIKTKKQQLEEQLKKQQQQLQEKNQKLNGITKKIESIKTWRGAKKYTTDQINKVKGYLNKETNSNNLNILHSSITDDKTFKNNIDTILNEIEEQEKQEKQKQQKQQNK